MKRWLRFSLRTMLVLITALCIWLGFQVNAARRQREAVTAILNAGGIVAYDYQVVSRRQRTSLAPGISSWQDYSFDSGRATPGPKWLRQYIGDDYFRTAVGVRFFD